MSAIRDDFIAEPGEIATYDLTVYPLLDKHEPMKPGQAVTVCGTEYRILSARPGPGDGEWTYGLEPITEITGQ